MTIDPVISGADSHRAGLGRSRPILPSTIFVKLGIAWSPAPDQANLAPR